MMSHPSSLILEATRALTNLAATSQVGAVVDGGAITPLIQLLRHHGVPEEVKDQVAECFKNIAQDNIRFRDILLGKGVLELLIDTFVNRGDDWTFAREAVSELAYRGEHLPDFSLVEPTIRHLTEILKKDISQKNYLSGILHHLQLSERSAMSGEQKHSTVFSRHANSKKGSKTLNVYVIEGRNGEIVPADTHIFTFHRGIEVLPSSLCSDCRCLRKVTLPDD